LPDFGDTRDWHHGLKHRVSLMIGCERTGGKVGVVFTEAFVPSDYVFAKAIHPCVVFRSVSCPAPKSIIHFASD
jgi:hypothetical protein